MSTRSVSLLLIICGLFIGRNSTFAVDETSRSEYWAKQFGCAPKSYVDIRLAGRDGRDAPYTMASVADPASHSLAQRKELWVVIGLQPTAGEQFPQALVARAERFLPDFEGRSGTILLARGT